MALYHAEEAGLIHNVDEDEPPQEVDHLVVLVICRRIVKQDIQLASQCANFGHHVQQAKVQHCAGQIGPAAQPITSHESKHADSSYHETGDLG